RAAWAFASTGLPSSLARTTASRSAGRGRLPTWVVRIRSMLRFMVLPACYRRPRESGARYSRGGDHGSPRARGRQLQDQPHSVLHDVPHHPFALGRRPLVEFRIHPARHALARERRLEFLANGGILLVIRYGAAAFAKIDGAVVHELLAGTAGLARALGVGPGPGGGAQAFLAGAEWLVDPVAAHGRRRDQPDRLVVLAQHLVGLAVPPRRGAERFRPGIGVALALDADQDGGGGVLVRLGIAAGLVLADPQIEAVGGHERLDPAVAGRAAGVGRAGGGGEREGGVDEVGNEIGAPHREPADRIRLDIVAGFEKILRPGEALAERIGTVEDEIGVVDHVHDVRRRGPAQEQRGRARRIHEPVVGVERDREQRALLPLERVPLALPFLPDLGGAAAFAHEPALFVEVPLHVERAGGGNFDEVKAPQPLGAEELDIRAAAAEPLPRRQREILYAANPDTAIDRHALGLHEAVVRHRRALELAVSGVLAGFRFVPVHLIGSVVHGFPPHARSPGQSRAPPPPPPSLP